MIINNAGSRRDVGFWTKHLQNDVKNTRAELVEVRGLCADNLKDALLEMQQDARILPRLDNFMYHADFNPRTKDRLTEEQWQRMFEIFEQQRGIPAGQPRIVYEHEKYGRVHRHVIWSRVDLENMRAFPDGWDAKEAHAAARAIAEELGLKRVISPFDKDREGPRPKRAPKPWEMYRGMQTAIDPRDVTAEVTELFHESGSSKTFKAALEEHGYMLLKGDRRGFVILDAAGDDHSLARRLDGITTKELNAFMRDLDREALPSVAQGRALYQERKEASLEQQLTHLAAELQLQQEHERKLQREDLEKLLAAELYERAKKYPNHYATYWQERISPELADQVQQLKDDEAAHDYAERHAGRDDRAWEDAVAKAAIEKERIEQQFVEREEPPEAPAGGREAEREKPAPAPAAEKTLNATAAGIRLAYTLSDSAAGFENNLAERHIRLAYVRQEEAERSHRNAVFAREVGRWAPEYREGEYVAVDRRGHVYALNRATTGQDKAAIEKYMGTLNPMHYGGIDSARRKQEIERRADKERQREQEKIRNDKPLSETAARIRFAYSLSDSPAGFVKNLDEYGIRLAHVTEQEAERSRTGAPFAKELSRFAPEYQAGEYVALSPRGHVFRLNERTTGDSRAEVDAFLRTLDASKIQGIDATRQEIAGYKRPAQARELWHEEQRRARLPLFTAGMDAHSAKVAQQFGRAAGEMTQRDHAPRDVQGPSGEIWTAFARSDNARALVNALKDKNIEVARVSREDVKSIQADNFHAQQQGQRTRPEHREGEYVGITDTGRIYRFNQRTTGQPAAAVQKFMAATLDQKEFQSIEGMQNIIQQRYALRDIERQAFRDRSSIGILKSRAIDPLSRPTGWHGRPQNLKDPKAPRAAAVIAKAADLGIGKALDAAGTALESLFAPKLTPEQKYRGAKANIERQADAEQQIDFSKYTAERAQQRRNLDNNRAGLQRERDERERS